MATVPLRELVQRAVHKVNADLHQLADMYVPVLERRG